MQTQEAILFEIGGDSSRLLQGFLEQAGRIRDQERRRIARELHDSTSQNLVEIGLLLASLKKHIPDWNPGDRQILDEASEQISEVLSEIRSFAYLRNPPSLEQHGLVGAMERYIAGFTRITGLPVTFSRRIDNRWLLPSVEFALYRILQEALANVHRHANALKASVRLSGTANAIRLTVADDGVGLPESHFVRIPDGSMGIESMKSRAQEIGGRVSLLSSKSGTKVIATIPSSAINSTQLVREKWPVAPEDALIGHCQVNSRRTRHAPALPHTMSHRQPEQWQCQTNVAPAAWTC